ncbi:hypothetical protein PPTG_21233 [Phytophthora nicotianae INRA-310]|uniref:Uncharacterized protein n=1 Tax=Phytophthora nicotianae (strain INRA-310) TaxID=761204 RepID=W2R5W6_PHYN3|nr:hypothetical protein PPTG_21233 [Phytophthora nicotianae INRA-310]ETN20119.1 hypothetical protein PPTG_21233 [Phytophthora nicotianae INRA-310]
MSDSQEVRGAYFNNLNHQFRIRNPHATTPARAWSHPTSTMLAIHGRIPGSENYSKEDLHIFLNEIENILPTGANEWDAVLRNYQIYAERESRALRTAYEEHAKISVCLKNEWNTKETWTMAKTARVTAQRLVDKDRPQITSGMTTTTGKHADRVAERVSITQATMGSEPKVTALKRIGFLRQSKVETTSILLRQCHKPIQRVAVADVMSETSYRSLQLDLIPVIEVSWLAQSTLKMLAQAPHQYLQAPQVNQVVEPKLPNPANTSHH